MAAPAQLSADQSNKHTDKYQSLYKSRKKSQDGKSSTAMWDYFKPVLIYGDPPAEGQPKPVVGVQVQTLCDKLLSAGNVSNTEKDKEVERAFWIEDLAEADDDQEIEMLG
jgi:hypothetical protein